MGHQLCDAPAGAAGRTQDPVQVPLSPSPGPSSAPRPVLWASLPECSVGGGPGQHLVGAPATWAGTGATPETGGRGGGGRRELRGRQGRLQERWPCGPCDGPVFPSGHQEHDAHVPDARNRGLVLKLPDRREAGHLGAAPGPGAAGGREARAPGATFLPSASPPFLFSPVLGVGLSGSGWGGGPLSGLCPGWRAVDGRCRASVQAGHWGRDPLGPARWGHPRQQAAHCCAHAAPSLPGPRPSQLEGTHADVHTRTHTGAHTAESVSVGVHTGGPGVHVLRVLCRMRRGS